MLELRDPVSWSELAAALGLACAALTTYEVALRRESDDYDDALEAAAD